jgi:hypothetical protein
MTRQNSCGLPALLMAATLPYTALHAEPRIKPAFRHIVLVIQENRTPDNLFGSNPHFEPGVDVATSGINSLGQTVPLGPVALASCYDISHSHGSFKQGLANSADLEPITLQTKGCKPPADPQFKYVDNSTGTVQPYFDLARQYGFANRMFQTNQGPSFPAHQFLFGGTSAPMPDTPLFTAENMTLKETSGCTAPAGQTVALIGADGLETSHSPIYPCLDHPTLADLLEAATPALTWHYYAAAAGGIWTAPTAISHICRARGLGLARQCTSTNWTTHVEPLNPPQLLLDIAACNLKSVSCVTPTGQDSDHAGINDGSGPSWVAQIVNAVGGQRCATGEDYWSDTAILVLWDDWGGWYDHVKPFLVTTPPSWGSGYTYGFRVPLLVISAFTQTGYVSNNDLDFGSLLYFVEQNFGLGFIGAGTDTYTRYADSQAAPRGAMEGFFALAKPRPFVPIDAPLDREYFVNDHRPALAPDND